MEAASLVSDDIVIRIIAERIDQPDCANGLHPRRLPAHAAAGRRHSTRCWPSRARSSTLVIELKVDDAALVDRISGRFTCAKCGAGYHDTLQADRRSPGVCDECGSTEFVRRADDNAETVKNRLMAYYRETAPLIGYYFAKGKLKTVDGMAPIDEVAGQIERILAGCRRP